ncbi:hypothetical protein IQ279_03285 [Streptomyces verrucosisporus]|uniref:hypothetical protein n=1 Tax=Streptomyces verrucosisporus TaxID=1695161 RepID=UPI0019D2E68F|nr:hypothetical protein [Streptomyces verrucosisporus]MBN3928677.1 hypothetical protein [Streptomyces verrucosisporus]
MKITSRILAVAAASGALLATTASAHAADVLNIFNTKRLPVSVPSSGNTTADSISIADIKQGLDRRGRPAAQGDRALVKAP